MSEDLFNNFRTKEYSFVFPSSEIYDGLALFDYGQYGSELKATSKLLVESCVATAYCWHRHLSLCILPVETLDMVHSTTLTDIEPKRYRADVLIEDYAEKQHEKRKKLKKQEKIWKVLMKPCSNTNQGN